MAKKNAETMDQAFSETAVDQVAAGVIPTREWKKLDTADEAPVMEQAEWVTLAEGVVLEGMLMRGFVIPDKLNPGGYRVGYVIQDDQGNEWTFGEKAAFKTAIRALSMGATIKLTVGKKEKQIDPKTKRPNGKTIWRIRLDLAEDGVGDVVLDALKKSHAALVESGGDLPF